MAQSVECRVRTKGEYPKGMNGAQKKWPVDISDCTSQGSQERIDVAYDGRQRHAGRKASLFQRDKSKVCVPLRGPSAHISDFNT